MRFEKGRFFYLFIHFNLWLYILLTDSKYIIFIFRWFHILWMDFSCSFPHDAGRSSKSNACEWNIYMKKTCKQNKGMNLLHRKKVHNIIVTTTENIICDYWENPLNTVLHCKMAIRENYLRKGKKPTRNNQNLRGAMKFIEPYYIFNHNLLLSAYLHHSNDTTAIVSYKK